VPLPVVSHPLSRGTRHCGWVFFISRINTVATRPSAGFPAVASESQPRMARGPGSKYQAPPPRAVTSGSTLE